MNGIEILSTMEVVTKYEYFWGLFAFFVIAVGAICFFIPRILGKSIDDAIGHMLGGFLIGSLIGGMLLGLTAKPVEYETRYKVLISEEVNLLEFIDKYEIVEQDGLIYTIRERVED